MTCILFDMVQRLFYAESMINSWDLILFRIYFPLSHLADALIQSGLQTNVLLEHGHVF